MTTIKTAADSDKPDYVAFERRYSDDSGVEIGVVLDQRKAATVRIETVGIIEVATTDLDWLIDRLEQVRELLK